LNSDFTLSVFIFAYSWPQPPPKLTIYWRTLAIYCVNRYALARSVATSAGPKLGFISQSRSTHVLPIFSSALGGSARRAMRWPWRLPASQAVFYSGRDNDMGSRLNWKLARYVKKWAARAYTSATSAARFFIASGSFLRALAARPSIPGPCVTVRFLNWTYGANYRLQGRIGGFASRY
jgi:hypothetical protein